MKQAQPKNLTLTSLYQRSETWQDATEEYKTLLGATRKLALEISSGFNTPERTPANPILAGFHPFDLDEARQLNRAIYHVEVIARCQLGAWAKEKKVSARQVLMARNMPIRDKKAIILALFSTNAPAAFEAPLPEALRVLPDRMGAPAYHPEATPNVYQGLVAEALNHELNQKEGTLKNG